MANLVIPVCIESSDRSSIIVIGESNSHYCSMAISAWELESSRVDILTRTYETILLAIAREDPSILSLEYVNWLSTSESWDFK